MRGGGRSGFILVAVLSIMLLITGLVGSVSLIVRAEMETVSEELSELAANGLIKAGIELAAFQLLHLEQKPEALNGQQIRLDSGSVTLSISTDNGKVDINGADPLLLEAVYKSAGLKAGRGRLSARAFAARLVDWRDPDDDKTGEVGAEGADYEEAKRRFRPGNRAFRSVDELQWVLGLKAEDIEKLRPSLTVHSPSGTLNLFDVSRELLQALAIPRGNIDKIMKARSKRTEATAARLMSFVSGKEAYFNAAVVPVGPFKVKLSAVPKHGAAQSVEVIIIRDPTGRQAFRTISWVNL